MPESFKWWLTAVLFTATYLALAVGKIPKLRVDRAGIAFVGAAFMLCTGVLSLSQATAPNSIDYQTLFLLFGMMVVVGFLRLSGFFVRVAHWTLDRITSPRGLLAAIILLSGVLSAFLVNDIVCLAMTPLVLQLTRRLGYRPVPHLIGLATAANIGSSGTITGNPQNMFIGSHSHISYLHFAIHLMPIAMLGLIIDYVVILLIYRRSLASEREQTAAKYRGFLPGEERIPNHRPHVRLQWKSGIVALVTVVLFFTGLPIALVAIGAAGLLMLSRIRPARIYREVDWSLLLMFTGLFIVVHAFQMHVVNQWGIERWNILFSHPVDLLSAASALLSNLVSNVPAVLLFEPVMHAMPAAQQQTAWLALAMSSTLAGNLTILGSVANLIVVENARRGGVEVSFWDYSKAGVPITILTLALGVAWLTWVQY
ncbi:MAG TPA: anion transporter [Tepidisphaeraceae bacterium]|nr:anion transporter [Tepidisphaeraceae bacterium]